MTEAPPLPEAHDSRDKLALAASIPFFLTHVWAVWAVFHTGFSWTLLAVGLASYYARMVGVTMGYHRYFSHRTFKTGRVFQFFLAWLAESSMQKGALWWASHHRHHHKFSDMPEDIHSPKQKGFWWSHVGWMLSNRYDDYDKEKIKDFTKYPELVWLDRNYLVPPLATGAVIWAIWGYDVFLWAGIVATVVLWHGTFTINSLSHVFGTRPYLTTDTSRNNFLLALITCGEGWHNNHHFYQSTANQGWHWWQLDFSYAVIKACELFGIVWDVRTPPEHIVAATGEQGIRRAKPAGLGAVKAAVDEAVGHAKEAVGAKVEAAKHSVEVAKHNVEARVEAAKHTVEERVETAKEAVEAAAAKVGPLPSAD